MSRFTSPENKRSLSFSAVKTSRWSANESSPFEHVPNQNQSYLKDDRSHDKEKYPSRFNTDSKTERSFKSSYETEIILNIEVERLRAQNKEIKSDNRVLARKLGDNSDIQDRVGQLEALNQQLLKDIAKKDDLLFIKDQELRSVKQESDKARKFQSGYAEILLQNKMLIDDVSRLKDQLESAQATRRSLEAKEGLEDQLRCANAQIEMLVRDNNRKTFEIEVLTNQVTRLQSENEKTQNDFRARDQADEINKLLLDNERLSLALREESRRADGSEAEMRTLRTRIDETESEVEGLNIKLLKFQELEEDIRVRGKNVERISIEKSNEATKQMLREKISYEQKIACLEDTVKSLEMQAAEYKLKFEEETKYNLEEIKRLQNEKEMLREHQEAQTRAETQLERHHRAEKALESMMNEKVSIQRLLMSHVKSSEDSTRCSAQSPGQEFLTPKKRLQGLSTNASANQYSDSKIAARLEDEVFNLNRTILSLEEKCKKSEIEANLAREELKRNQQEKRSNPDHEDLERANAMLHLKMASNQKRLDEISFQADESTKEAEKLRNLYAQVSSQLEAEKKSNKKTSSDRNRQEELERELTQLRRRELDMKELTLRLETERKLYNNEINQLALLNQNAKEELEKLYEISAHRKEECDSYADHNQHLKREVNKLRDLLEHYARSNDETNEDYLDLQATLEGYEKEKNVLKFELDKLNTQLEQSNVRLSNKVDEAEEAEMPRVMIRLTGDY